MNDQDDLPQENSLIPLDQLKHGKGRFSSVILVPQPSDDPNDPLNVCIGPRMCGLASTAANNDILTTVATMEKGVHPSHHRPGRWSRWFIRSHALTRLRALCSPTASPIWLWLLPPPVYLDMFSIAILSLMRRRLWHSINVIFSLLACRMLLRIG